jgi:hypothetical protein
MLRAFQSGGLDPWLPAEHDEVIPGDGIIETRRAWLPLGTRGFLRLEAVEAP